MNGNLFCKFLLGILRVVGVIPIVAAVSWSAGLSAVEPERKREWQPVQEYITTIDPKDAERLGMEKGQRINPFLSYTAIGTDYGFLGPDASRLGWSPHHIHIRLTSGQWAGIWHSLTKRGMDAEWMLDFQRCYPPWFTDAFQPRITGIKLRGHGHGRIKVEIKDNKQEVLWSDGGMLENQKEDIEAYRELPKLGKAKYLNWIASTDSELSVDMIGLEVEMPPVPFDMEVFLKSYAKLSICYSMKSGLVADRAHVETGAFDCVPATGMFCLASAAAAHHGITSREFALTALRRAHEIISKLNAPRGVLPHFIKQIDGRYRIHPGTEYSTVDTAIYYHSMLLAAQMLEDAGTFQAVLRDMRRLDFAQLRDAEGYVFHGLKEDGTPLPAAWRDWGGETALVLLMQRAVSGAEAPALMHHDGKVWQGTGFIPEIQSLFYPQFDLEEPDHVTRQSWPEVRTTLLKRQKEYFSGIKGQALASGFYGLSAGEASRGLGYLVSGVDLPQQEIIHPHYMLMSGCMAGDTAEVYALLQSLEDQGYFPPVGLAENINVKTGDHLPMLGSLNAAFEAISACHLLARHRAQPDPIYEAAKKCAVLSEAARLFFPQ
ncbi:MAG TPA: hypothetical protein VLE43_17970 [Candidatus Saccharimonadia bacterium]|nr:hypothetical protein [Candidatus Saccharimonadia bacterium]